ncbi:hypothetical protein OSC27_01400 [Microbacterium sp. STN6]|uniref:TadE/TadG family type IV pilus assembly protein n=1 Tax=Microbacterium sp. STN6 TaxID=2995588 RepID=UPI00226092E7|nr:TadE/TadG family type IV pilus assembly protein [Microbacterium sp. STN6]MCX7520926.1 hypothetical protein [Microbacterium sp. STN6]
MARVRGERGAITAEFAVAMPAVILVLAACLACLQLASSQSRLAVAAAQVARALGRGDTALAAQSVAQVGGATMSHEQNGSFVCVQLRAPAAAHALISAITLEARSCALAGGL